VIQPLLVMNQHKKNIKKNYAMEKYIEIASENTTFLSHLLAAVVACRIAETLNGMAFKQFLLDATKAFSTLPAGTVESVLSLKIKDKLASYLLLTM